MTSEAMHDERRVWLSTTCGETPPTPLVDTRRFAETMVVSTLGVYYGLAARGLAAPPGGPTSKSFRGNDADPS